MFCLLLQFIKKNVLSTFIEHKIETKDIKLINLLISQRLFVSISGGSGERSCIIYNILYTYTTVLLLENFLGCI